MIQFNFHDVEEFELLEEDLVSWLTHCLRRYGKKVEMLDITLCTDEYLLNLNKQHLNHDYYTDILTFDLSVLPDLIQGELYISIERVKDNASQLNISWVDELHRVIVHGVLHLCGFDDKDEVSEVKMRQEEDVLLSLRMF